MYQVVGRAMSYSPPPDSHLSGGVGSPGCLQCPTMDQVGHLTHDCFLLLIQDAATQGEVVSQISATPVQILHYNRGVQGRGNRTMHKPTLGFPIREEFRVFCAHRWNVFNINTLRFLFTRTLLCVGVDNARILAAAAGEWTRPINGRLRDGLHDTSNIFDTLVQLAD